MKNLSALLYLIMFALSFGGCNDDDHPSKEELLTSGSGRWKLSELRISAPDGQTVDEFSSLNTCIKDNIILFSLNPSASSSPKRSYQVLEAATKCDPFDPDVIETGTWSIAKNTLSTTETGGDTGSATIVELTESRMVLAMEVEDSGVTSMAIFGYTKQ
jgi:hypothetical protein